MEASTPFVSLRAVLANLGLKSSRRYAVNGVVMIGVFFTCRILLVPYVYYLYGRQIGTECLVLRTYYAFVIKYPKNIVHRSSRPDNVPAPRSPGLQLVRLARVGAAVLLVRTHVERSYEDVAAGD